MLTSIKNAVFYHIYPLGFCGVINNRKSISSASGFNKFDDKWINHLKNMGINAIYFGPIFQSSYHGYDTIDYLKIDERLGTNSDFKNIVSKLHANNIRVIIDGVFNHVGREFWAFVDVKNNKSNSQYSSWFNIDFNGNSNYNDGFYYEGWEGHYDLVKLNLYNKDVKCYLLHVVEEWINEFDIDGIRLDVAYLLDKDFIKELRFTTNKLKNDFVNKQHKIINNNKIIDTDITKTIYKNILSIKISYILYGDLSNYEEILILNYNLKDKKIVNNDNLLEMTNVTYKDIADSLFTDYIKIEDTSSVVIDAITNEKLTGTEFNDNSYKYITRIRENLPDIMSLYIKDNKLYYAVKLKDINKLCYQTNIDVSGKYIDKEIDKL